MDVQTARLRRLDQPGYSGEVGPEDVALVLKACGRDARPAAAAFAEWVVTGRVDTAMVDQAERLIARSAPPGDLPEGQLSASDVDAAAPAEVAEAMHDGKLRALDIGDGRDRYGRVPGPQRQGSVPPEVEAEMLIANRRKWRRWMSATGGSAA